MMSLFSVKLMVVEGCIVGVNHFKRRVELSISEFLDLFDPTQVLPK